MRPQTRAIKRRLQRAWTMDKRLRILRDAYHGETCYLLATGPSLGAFWDESVKERLRERLVVAVKQAFDLAPEIVDFQLLNAWNYSVYDYTRHEPIIVAERADNDPPTPGLKADLLFRVPEPNNWEKRLATTLEFDRYLFERTKDRPWGPGVVYELGLYLAVHIGVKEIVTLGWDLGELNSPTMPHFFPEEPGGSGKSDGIQNKPRIRTYEVQDIAGSTHAVYYWLRSKGIYLYVCSDRSLVDAVVPRVSIHEESRRRWLYRTDLVGNGDFALWSEAGPTYWVGRPAGGGIRQIGDAGGGVAAELVPTVTPGDVSLEQTVRAEPFFSGATLRCGVDAWSEEAGKLGLMVALVERGRAEAARVFSVDHPGGGHWSRLGLDVDVPADINVAQVTFRLIHRAGARKPARVGNVRVTMERSALGG